MHDASEFPFYEGLITKNIQIKKQLFEETGVVFGPIKKNMCGGKMEWVRGNNF